MNKIKIKLKGGIVEQCKNKKCFLDKQLDVLPMNSA